MGFLDKAKAAAVEATAKAKEGVEDVQLKRELSQAYNELGKITFELVEGNDITHPKLETVVEKIRALNERDQGSVSVAIGHDQGRVTLQFPKNLNWIGFTADQAMDIASSLIEHARACGSKKVLTVKVG